MAHHEIPQDVPLRRSWVKLCPVSVCVFVLLLLSGAATGQQPAAIPPNKIEIVPSTIEYVPPLAQSVLARNPGQVIRLLEAQVNVDERVRGKDGARAGFTPLILAAALSDAEMAQLLIRRGAKTTTLDDFHRSAFWYAALREDVKLTSILAEAPDAKEAVNVADNDLQRTPLHIAVHSNAPELVRLLLRVGASKELKDILEETPVDYCKRRVTAACSGLEGLR